MVTRTRSSLLVALHDSCISTRKEEKDPPNSSKTCNVRLGLQHNYASDSQPTIDGSPNNIQQQRRLLAASRQRPLYGIDLPLLKPHPGVQTRCWIRSGWSCTYLFAHAKLSPSVVSREVSVLCTLVRGRHGHITTQGEL